MTIEPFRNSRNLRRPPLVPWMRIMLTCYFVPLVRTVLACWLVRFGIAVHNACDDAARIIAPWLVQIHEANKRRRELKGRRE